jgi:hypothetical protein
MSTSFSHPSFSNCLPRGSHTCLVCLPLTAGNLGTVFLIDNHRDCDMLTTMTVLFRSVPRYALMVLCGLSAVACLSPASVVEIDREEGFLLQRALIEKYFTGTDTRDRRPARATGAQTGAVSAAWWGFDAADSTACLQAALDAGAAVVLVPRMEGPWICEALFIRSRTTLILEEGVELLAKKGAFRPTTGALLNINDTDQVTVSGYGAVIRMRKRDYTAPPYAKGEWRHTIQICGGSRVAVLGLTAAESGGDGVYLGRGGTRVTNTDILLKDLVLKDHHRQGASVITAVNLLIENCELSDTSGTAPSAGIDFEPNMPDEPLRNCRLKNCLIRNNAGAGFQLYILYHTSASDPFDITLEDCTVYGNLAGVFVAGLKNGARGRLMFIHNRIYGLQLIPSASGHLQFVEE